MIENYKQKINYIFTNDATSVTQEIINTYQKLFELLITLKRWQLNKKDWIDKMVDLQNKMVANEQTKDLTNKINWGTLEFCGATSTVLNKYIKSVQ
jgi:hypothetical protein